MDALQAKRAIRSCIEQRWSTFGTFGDRLMRLVWDRDEADRMWFRIEQRMHSDLRCDYMDARLRAFTSDLALSLSRTCGRNVFFDVREGWLVVFVGE